MATILFKTSACLVSMTCILLTTLAGGAAFAQNASPIPAPVEEPPPPSESIAPAQPPAPPQSDPAPLSSEPAAEPPTPTPTLRSEDVPEPLPTPQSALAATNDDSQATWYEDLSLNAFVSTAYVYNFANPRGLVANPARVFDADNNSFKVDVAEIVIQDEPERLGEAGFRLDVVHGIVVPVVIGGADLALQQAYVSYIAPWGTGLRFDVGTFLSHIGAETIEGYDNVNDNYSRSLLFRGQPAELTGARVTYRVMEAVSITALAVNGWLPNIIDTNAAKTFGLQLELNPMRQFAFFVHYVAGPERPGDNHNWRHLVDAVAALRLAPVTLTLEGQFGHESTDAPAAPYQWGGGLLTVRWDVCPGFTLAARGEYLDDTSNFLNLGTQLWELTVTPTLRFTENMLLRIELRHDHNVGRTPIFPTSDGVSTSQTTLAGNFLFVF